MTDSKLTDERLREAIQTLKSWQFPIAEVQSAVANIEAALSELAERRSVQPIHMGVDYAREGGDVSVSVVAMPKEMYDQMQNELAELRAASQWQPIGTAPRDGSYVLTFCNRFTNKLGRSGGGIMEAHYIKYQDCWDTHVWWNIKGEACYPTHWMPLPTPPKEDGNDH